MMVIKTGTTYRQRKCISMSARAEDAKGDANGRRAVAAQIAARSASAVMVVTLLLTVVMLAAGLRPAAAGRQITDSAGRSVNVPDRIERVMAAGPPASVLLYVLCPEKLVGWVRKPRRWICGRARLLLPPASLPPRRMVSVALASRSC